MTQEFPGTFDIFCRVIDNYGDIGVCWRLARQLAHRPHTRRVRLWVDDLSRCQALVPSVNTHAAEQDIAGVHLLHWNGQTVALAPAQVVIEAFGCDPPAEFIHAMQPHTCWINLEYLSAEDWVEGCHALPSPQPDGKIKWFFFPGFTPKTGGLLREPGLLAARDAWLADPRQRHALWQALRLPPAPLRALRAGARQVFLFCYPHAPITALLHGLIAAQTPTVVLAAPGMVDESHQRLVRDRGVHLCTIPFLPQDQFDALLWSSDLNCVRGEDSLVRALWAARPLLWHLYPQAHAAHLDKLDAWLARARAPARVAELLRGWNASAADPGAAAVSTLLARNLAPAAWDAWCSAARQWCQSLAQQTDLVSALCAFVRSVSASSTPRVSSSAAPPRPTQRPSHTDTQAAPKSTATPPSPSPPRRSGADRQIAPDTNTGTSSPP